MTSRPATRRATRAGAALALAAGALLALGGVAAATGTVSAAGTSSSTQHVPFAFD